VEVMRNSYKNLEPRGGTFAHVFAITVSSVGVYIYQSYGARGYTLLQNIEKYNSKFPLNHNDGLGFVEKFTKLVQLSFDMNGKWTVEINDLYNQLFDIDLCLFKSMEIGSQYDPYVKIQTFPFDLNTVKENFELNLAKYNLPKYKCLDFEVANGKRNKDTMKYCIGGVKQKYIPKFTDYPIENNFNNYLSISCQLCGLSSSLGLLQCSACKKVSYCCKNHQKTHWKSVLKNECNKG
jgi:hypothetical protein